MSNCNCNCNCGGAKNVWLKLEIFVPTTHLEQIAAALRQSGAGSSDRYDSVLSYSLVTGRWRPKAGANPYQGEVGQLCEAEEYKVEACCHATDLATTISALKAAHPYEEPLINVLELLSTSLADEIMS